MITDFKKIDSLSSSDFEFFVRDVFVAAGWSDAVITKVGQEFQYGDGGVEIFAYKAKRKFAIEVKRRAVGTTVDIKALNQLVTGAKLANVANWILVTNSYFTSEVKVRALRLGVELIDRDRNVFRAEPISDDSVYNVHKIDYTYTEINYGLPLRKS